MGAVNENNVLPIRAGIPLLRHSWVLYLSLPLLLPQVDNAVSIVTRLWTGWSGFDAGRSRNSVRQHVQNAGPSARAAAHLLRSWVRIQLAGWMFVCCECCVLSGKGLCDGLITRPGESYQLWRVVVCDQETS